MTKSEIVKEISARTGIDGKAVLAVVEGFINEVKTSLGKEENVYLRGFVRQLSFRETIFALLRFWRQLKKSIANMVVPKNFFLTDSCLSMR